MIDYSALRGFNYSGSWGTSGLDLWMHHDSATMAVEIARGKRYFPGWNVARWWLSHEAFQRDRVRFAADLEAGLAIFASHGIQVMPVLFNRWRDPVCDFGGVPLDHIVHGLSVFTHQDDFSETRPSGAPTRIDSLYRDYLDSIVGSHAEDERILAWDLCNEPFMGSYVGDAHSTIRAAELRWLEWCAAVVRDLHATQPITIGNYLSLEAIDLTAAFTDFISFHPYFIPADRGAEPVSPDPTRGSTAHFEQQLDAVLSAGARHGQPVVASETVWGGDDAQHVEIADYTLGVLGERSIGFIVHALHHSLVADLHDEEFGPVGPPGRLEFINADGSLRAGHEVFNRY